MGVGGLEVAKLLLEDCVQREEMVSYLVGLNKPLTGDVIE